MSLKTFIRKVVRKYGYQIQKYPVVAFSPIPVFDLSVQLLMAVRGDSLNFIQVGANDGKYGDPLHSFIVKYPWHGILVEPQPNIFAKLRENYAAMKNRLIFENIAIAKDLSTIAMYRAPENPDVYEASVVSVNPKAVARQLGLKLRHLERFFVPCTTLDELVKKYVRFIRSQSSDNSIRARATNASKDKRCSRISQHTWISRPLWRSSD
jgi:FkbM family methyltransferase